MAPSSASAKNGPSPPSARRPPPPAAPHMPKPGPALRPFSRISAFASSSSCRTSVLVSLASCFRSSPTGCSRMSWPLSTADIGSSSSAHAVVERLRRRELGLLRRGGSLLLQAALVALLARGLQEPRREEARDDAAERERPGLLPCEALDVPQHAVAVGFGQVGGE